MYDKINGLSVRSMCKFSQIRMQSPSPIINICKSVILDIW